MDEISVLPTEETRLANDYGTADLAARIAEEKANRNLIMRFAESEMVEGTDFHIIKDKKSLGKPGAEKICSLFHVTIGVPEVAQDVLDSLPQKIKDSGAIIFRTKLYRNGEYIGSGIGGRTVQQDGGDLNKALKMARKASVVDAAISTFGLSSLFTQDIEDMDPDKIGNKTSYEKKSYDKPRSYPTPSADRPASPAQTALIKKLYMQKEADTDSEATKKANKVASAAEASKIIQNLIGKPSQEKQESELPSRQYDEISPEEEFFNKI